MNPLPLLSSILLNPLPPKNSLQTPLKTKNDTKLKYFQEFARKLEKEMPVGFEPLDHDLFCCSS